MTGEPGPWWKGRRGEWLVVLQVLLIALVFFGPRTLSGWPAVAFPFPRAMRIVGAILMVAGIGLFLAGILRLGPGLTPLPYPREGARLEETGAYALVRHPIYGGGLILAIGWALLVGSWLTLAYVVVLFVFLEFKSRREEQWLSQKFPGYHLYRKRVRKLIPFIY